MYGHVIDVLITTKPQKHSYSNRA